MLNNLNLAVIKRKPRPRRRAAETAFPPAAAKKKEGGMNWSVARTSPENLHTIWFGSKIRKPGEMHAELTHFQPNRSITQGRELDYFEARSGGGEEPTSAERSNFVKSRTSKPQRGGRKQRGVRSHRTEEIGAYWLSFNLWGWRH